MMSCSNLLKSNQWKSIWVPLFVPFEGTNCLCVLGLLISSKMLSLLSTHIIALIRRGCQVVFDERCQDHQKAESPAYVQMMCPLSHSSKLTTNNPKQGERMTGLQVQICTSEACDVCMMSVGLSRSFLSNTHICAIDWIRQKSRKQTKGRGTIMSASHGNTFTGRWRL